MPTIFVKGDMLASDLSAIAHGCNCAGAMGAGIAAQIRERCPNMYRAYRTRCRTGEFRLGDVMVWRAGSGFVVFNLGTQAKPGSRASFAAINQSVTNMLSIAEKLGISHIGIPKIGAGLGGLSWTGVRETLIKLGARTNVTLVVFETYVPGLAVR